MRRSSRCLFVLVPLLALGCGDDDAGGVDDFDDLDDPSDVTVATTDVDDWESSMVYGVTDPFEDPYFYDDPFFLTLSDEAPVGDPAGAATVVADATALYFTPSDCAEIARDGANLTYTLSGCNGRFGSHEIDGTMRVGFVDVPDGIGFNIATEGLQVDGLDAELTADGTYRSSGDVKVVQYNSERTLSGPDATLQGNFNTVLNWTAGSDCISRTARGTAQSGDQGLNVEVDGYTRCGESCPSEGVITANDSDTTWILTFDGSDQAALESSDGETEDVALACER